MKPTRDFPDPGQPSQPTKPSSRLVPGRRFESTLLVDSSYSLYQNPDEVFHSQIHPRHLRSNSQETNILLFSNLTPATKSPPFRFSSTFPDPDPPIPAQTHLASSHHLPQIESSSMEFLKFAVFLSLISVSFAHEPLNSHLLPRPLIIEYPETLGTRSAPDDEIRLQCTSWRVAVEANNVSPWKTIPEECADYVKEYMAGRGYGVDLERVSSEALSFARSVEVQEDGRDVWIFDIDETLLSNLPYYAEHGYGLEVFDNLQFDKWVETGKAAAIGPSLRLYEEVCGLGFKVFLMTGRGEKMRCVTVENLKDAGFQKWDRLMLRGSDDHGKSATAYKSEKRSQITDEGYRIIGNSGDQWSDLLGTPMSVRSFKLPNPMYFIP